MTKTTVSKWIEDCPETDECVLFPYYIMKATGYGQCYYKGSTWLAHRLSLFFKTGVNEKTLDAAHSCGNRACINPRHLSWKTRAENEADKNLHGTTIEGEKCARAKLTEQQVLAIRADSRSCTEIAKDYPVNRPAILKIKNRERWKHI